MTIWNEIQRELAGSTPAPAPAPSSPTSVWDEIARELGGPSTSARPPLVLRPDADRAGLAQSDLETQARASATAPLQSRGFQPPASTMPAVQSHNAIDTAITLARAPGEFSQGVVSGAAGGFVSPLLETATAVVPRLSGRPDTAEMLMKGRDDVMQALAPPDSASGYVGGVAGQAAGFMTALTGAGAIGRATEAVASRGAARVLPGIAARAAGTLAGGVASATPESTAEAASVYNDVLRQTGDQAQAQAAALKVFGGNIAMLSAMNIPLIGRMGGVRGIATRAASEGVQEGAQQALSNTATGRPTWEGVPQSAAIGAVAAPIVGGALDVAARTADVQTRQHQAEQPPTPTVDAWLQKQAEWRARQQAPETHARSSETTATPAETPTASVETKAPSTPTATARDSRVDALVRELNIGEDEAIEILTGLDADAASSSPAGPASALPSATSRQAATPALTPDAQAGTDVATPSTSTPVRRQFAEDALAHGYPGTVEEAEAEVVSRARELYDAVHGDDAERGGLALLRTIAEHGGITASNDPDTPGEARWLGEFRDLGQVNTIAGVRNVFRRTTRQQDFGQRVTGASLEDMAERLRAEGWSFESGDQLLQAIAQAKRDFDAGFHDDTFDVGYYAQGAGVEPGTRWWESQRQDDDALPAWAQDEDVVESDEPGVFGEPSEDQSGSRARWVDPVDHQAYDVGDFGPVFTQYAGDARGAVEKLRSARTGEAIGALHHPQLGPIDLVWGQTREGRRKGYGLAKIEQIHPDVMDSLGTLIPSMEVAQVDPERVHLVSPDHAAAVALSWHGQTKHWLLTAYRLDEGRVASGPERSLPVSGIAGQDARQPTDAASSIAPAETDVNRDADPDVYREPATPSGQAPPRTWGGWFRDRRARRAAQQAVATGSTMKPTFAAWSKQQADRRAGRVGDFERQGSPTRQPFFEEPSPALQTRYAQDAPLSEQQAVEALRDIFAEEAHAGSPLGAKAVPVSTRMGRVAKGSFGTYDPKSRLIRLKRSFDLATFTHELGHHIDLATFARTSRPMGVFAHELHALGRATSGASKSAQYRLREGVAEYLRVWFANPEVAQQRAPLFSQALEEAMDASPALRAQLEDGQAIVQRYVSQSLIQRGKARISVTPRDSARSAREMAERQYTKWIDDLAPLQRAVLDLAVERGEIPAVSANAYVLARNAARSAGKAQGFVSQGVRGREGRWLSGSLEAALRPVVEADRLYAADGRSDQTDFATYLVALRALEVRATGRDAGMTVPEATAIVASVTADPETQALFETARDKVYAYQRAVLTYAEQYGAFSREQVQTITQLSDHYVPLQRVIDGAGGSGSGRGVANRNSPVKRLKGSGRDIIDPIESIVKNTALIVDMVEQNRAMQALVAQATDAPGAGKWLVRVAPNQIATTLNLQQVSGSIRSALVDAGIDAQAVTTESGARAIEVEGQLVELDDLVTIFQPSQIGNPKQRLVTAIVGGQRQFWEVQDQALYDAITQMGARPSAEILKWTEKAVAGVRAGTVLAPAFAIRNVMRDTVGAMIQSRHGFIPVWDSVRGAVSMIRQDEDYRQFLASGVQAAVKVDVKRQRLRDEVNRITRKRGTGRATAYYARHWIEALRAFSEAFEVSTRLGEFKLARESRGAERRGGVVGIAQRLTGTHSTEALTSEEDILTRATLAAADVTVDFSRGGTTSKEISRWSAFFNARMQSYARIGETVRRDPVGVGLTMATLAALQAALWSLNADDEEYQELSPQVKRDYWVLRTGERAWTFISKPHEWAMVPNLVEGYLEYLKHEDPDALKQLLPQAGTQVLLTLAGTGILPWIEVMANRDLYRGRDIVPAWKEKLDPELQDNEWTTDAARVAGRALGVSPAKVEHIVRQSGGTLASEALSAADVLATPLTNPDRPSRAAKRVEQLPVVGGLFRDPSASSRSQSLQQWRERWDAYETAKASVAEFSARGDVDRARARVTQALDDLRVSAADRAGIERASRQAAKRSRRDLAVTLRIPQFEETKKAMGDLSKRRAEIEGSRTLTPHQKREQVDAVLAEQVQLARAALGKRSTMEALGLRPRRTR